MENQNKSFLIKRIIMTIVGVTFCGVSVGFFKAASFGVDPFTSFVTGVQLNTPLDSYGTIYWIISAIELIAIFLIDKSKIGLGTVINLFFLGYVVEFTQKLLMFICSAENSTDINIGIRILFLIIAIAILAVSSSLYFEGNMGVSTHDAVALIASERQSKISFKYCRIASDVFCLVLGFVLILVGSEFDWTAVFGNLNIGTVVTAVGTGPLIAFCRNKIAHPLLYGKDK